MHADFVELSIAHCLNKIQDFIFHSKPRYVQNKKSYSNIFIIFYTVETNNIMLVVHFVYGENLTGPVNKNLLITLFRAFYGARQ